MRPHIFPLTLLGLILILGFSPARTCAAETSKLHYSKAEVRKEIVATVEAQLAAFRAKDFALAYTFAAAGLRQQFTARQFATLIVRSYPVVANNERAEFGLPLDDGESAVVTVEVFAQDAHVSFRYSLVKEARGWRIAGVVESKSRSSDA